MGTVTVSQAAEMLHVSDRWVRGMLDQGRLAGRKDGWSWEIDSEALAAFAAQRASESRKSSEYRVVQVPRTPTTQQHAQQGTEPSSPVVMEGGGVARLLELEREKCRILAGEVARLANALATLGVGTDALEERTPEKVEARWEREPGISDAGDVENSHGR